MAPKPKKSKSKRKKRKPKTETIKQTQKVTQTVTIILPEKSKRKRKKRTAKKGAVQVQQRSTYPVVQFQPQQPFQQPPQPPLDRLNPIAINHRANLPAGIFNRPVQAQRQPFREMDTMSELTDEFQPIGQYVGEVPSSQEGLSVEFFQPGDDRSLSFTDSFVSDFQPGDDRSLSIREQESQEGLAGGFFQPGDDLSRDSLAGEPIPGILGLEPDELESIPESVEFYERGDERRTRKPRSDIDQPRPHVRERNRNAREIRRQIEEERRSLEENDRRMRDERRQQERELGDDITEIRNLVDSASESGTSV